MNVRIRALTGHENILEYLYKKYYLFSASSQVTSSHWKKYGGQLRVIKKDDDYELSGVGFGDFIQNSFQNYLRFSLPTFLSYSKLYGKIGSKIMKAGKQVAKNQKRIFNYDCVKQVLSVNLLFNYKLLKQEQMVVVIGDGYGYMTSLLKMLYPGSIIISVNLGKILLFDAYYVQRVFSQENVLLITDKEEMAKCSKEPGIYFLEAENYHYLFSWPINLFLNIASMQEMSMNVINTYFSIMRSSTIESYFYCCNRIEKKLPDGEIIRFIDYPWHEKDEIYVDELCPWYQKRPSSWPPFWKSFDGPIQHKLVKLYRELR